MISRRSLLGKSVGWGAALVVSRIGGAQQPGPATLPDTSNLFAMDQSAARSVRLPPKPGARPVLSADERDDLEHRIRCQCGCTLSVFICRTTDFSCQVSPAMHRDIIALVDGGYTAAEISDAFVRVYGDQALMSPPKEGFNILGYVLPGIAIAAGALVLGVVLRRWRKPVAGAGVPAADLDASPDELARLNAAIRDDS